MRILLLCEFYAPHIGGVERHVQTLAHELARRGHSIAVATQEAEGEPAVADDEGVTIYRLRGWNRLLSPFYLHNHSHFVPPFSDPGLSAQMRRVVQQVRPEIVHAHGWELYSFLPIKHWSGAKLVVTMHDYGLTCATKAFLQKGQLCSGPEYGKCLDCAREQYGSVKAFGITSALRVSASKLSGVDRFLAVSSAVRDAALESTDLEIEVVPTFIPDSSVRDGMTIERPAYLPPEDNYLLFVGRQSVHKGLDILLRAYEGLEALAPLVLMVADQGVQRREFPAHITVARNVPHAQVMAGWQYCAIGIVPSIWPEPFGQVAVEAMACSKPVVASASGGLRDAIEDAVTGLLVPPGDVDALRGALRSLLLDPERRRCMGVAGRERARLFLVSTVTNRIEQIYTELLVGQPEPALV